MTPEAAAWIRRVVLASHDDLEMLVDVCPCQWGPSGHCVNGNHERCIHHGRMPGYDSSSPDTYLCNRSGGALVAVWRVGKPCRWHCPCEVCRDAALLPGTETFGRGSRRRAKGDDQPPGRREIAEQPTLFDLVGAS